MDSLQAPLDDEAERSRAQFVLEGVLERAHADPRGGRGVGKPQAPPRWASMYSIAERRWSEDTKTREDLDAAGRRGQQERSW